MKRVTIRKPSGTELYYFVRDSATDSEVFAHVTELFLRTDKEFVGMELCDIDEKIFERALERNVHPLDIRDTFIINDDKGTRSFRFKNVGCKKAVFESIGNFGKNIEVIL